MDYNSFSQLQQSSPNINNIILDNDNISTLSDNSIKRKNPLKKIFNKFKKSDNENSDNSDTLSLSSTKSKNPFKKIINKL